MTAALSLAAPLLAAAEEVQRREPRPVDLRRGGRRLLLPHLPSPAAQGQGWPGNRPTAFDVGDEVSTAGGIVGHIIDIEGDR